MAAPYPCPATRRTTADRKGNAKPGPARSLPLSGHLRDVELPLYRSPATLRRARPGRCGRLGGCSRYGPAVCEFSGARLGAPRRRDIWNSTPGCGYGPTPRRTRVMNPLKTVSKPYVMSNSRTPECSQATRAAPFQSPPYPVKTRRHDERCSGAHTEPEGGHAEQKQTVVQ